MTSPPRRNHRDPLARQREQHVPPAIRSRAMDAMSARAATGRFVLQMCTDCRQVTYPPRDICPRCWGGLVWRDQPRGATIVAETTIRVSADLYFRDHLPWRMGKILLDAGPVALAHFHHALAIGDRAEVHLVLDRAGNAALFAVPAGSQSNMSDPQWREFIVPVEGRTILVSDARSAIGLAAVRALKEAGAATVIAGVPQPARTAGAGLDMIAGVRTVPLDLTDGRSVTRCLADIGDPLDIVVNTARFVRAGGVSTGNLLDQKRALDVGMLGLLRLARAAAPLLKTRPSGAFVDILSISALAGDAGFAGFSASEAARLSLLQSFRREMRRDGVRVISLFVGPIDDEDHQSAPLPKLAPARVASGLVEALENGREELCIGDAAHEAMSRWRADPALYVRESNA